MSAKRSLGKVLLYAMLAMASMFGSPIRADEIEALLRQGSETKIVHTLGDGDKPPDDGLVNGAIARTRSDVPPDPP